VRPLAPSHELYAAVHSFAPGARLEGAAGAAGADAGGKKEKKAGKAKKTAEEVAAEKAAKVAMAAPKEKEGKAKKEAKPVETYVSTTPKGEYKDLSKPMASGYDPAAVEDAWYPWWEKKGFFTPDAASAVNTCEEERFILCLPPPNVTGSLHLGHTLTGAIQDALCRWHRMCGHKTLYIPGTDHAGIATQSVVEKRLLKQEKLTRHDLGREKFLARVWEWKEKYGNTICQQLRDIGSSLDWSRECFTLDKTREIAVIEAFNRFYDEGKIFRGTRLVNWCPYLRTALSDLEVDYLDLTEKTMVSIPGTEMKVEVGAITSFKYKVKNSKESITVATTRLETMLGDTAVAVHPEDKRYTHLIGKELEHPFIKTRSMKVIADTMVDREFGTGAVKITPAHDFNDYKVGKQHNLEFIPVFSEEGLINSKGGPFAGQHRFEARIKVEEEMKKLGLYVDKKNNPMRLGICSRSGDIIEPMLTPQWWMNCDELAVKSCEAVRNGSLKILPAFHEGTWFYWLENIRDWCISRQLWWGHRIPAWKVVKPEQKDAQGEPVEKWYVGRNEAEAYAKAKKDFGASVVLAQDEDVLDTWFSSGLFPFSPLQWPNETHLDFKAFFPTSLLETGHDILFFWVARMVMMSIGLTGKLPFHTVYLHAMVRDAHGRKMSKSLGNVIEPNEVINGITLKDLSEKLKQGNLAQKEIEKAQKGQAEDFPNGIPQCGGDALRFGLLAYTLQGRSINLDINRVVAYRHFCNKLWNVVKFALSNFPEGYEPQGLKPNDKLFFEDEWIMSRYTDMVKKSNDAFIAYEFANATTATYNFWLYDLSDLYLEVIKRRMQTDGEEKRVALEVLFMCLDRGLRCLHPLLPFVTEELYQRLPVSPWKSESICIAQYPTEVPRWANPIVEENMSTLRKVIGAFRSLQASLNLHPRERPAAFVRHSDATAKEVLAEQNAICMHLGRLGSLQVLEGKAEPPAGCVASVMSNQCTVYLQVADIVDLASEAAKQEKKIEAAKKSLASYEAKMKDPNYEQRVPENVRKMNTEKSEALKKEIEETTGIVAALKKAIK
jgi:valyl-tRNA synthetase